jgi:hypothetical protein
MTTQKAKRLVLQVAVGTVLKSTCEEAGLVLMEPAHKDTIHLPGNKQLSSLHDGAELLHCPTQLT